MGTRAITGVLGLLRRLKKTEGLGLSHASLQFLQQWAGDHSPSVTLRLCVSIVEEIEDATNVVASSSLTEEAKEGLLATLSGLRAAFDLGGINTAINSYVPAIDSAITNFAIVSSLVGADFPEEAKLEIDNLVQEMTSLRDSPELAELDPALRQTVVRQLNAIIALLHNAAAVGVEAAISAYLDLLVKMRRAKPDEADPKAKESVWATVANWGGRLIKVSDLVDAGSKLLPLIEKAPDLLKLLG